MSDTGSVPSTVCDRMRREKSYYCALTLTVTLPSDQVVEFFM